MGDLLTAYDGVSITYDGMGNPLSDGTWPYTWEHGRQLAAMSNGTTTWTYTYDANGMRTSRSNGTDTYTYVYNGGQLVQMTVGTHTLYFTYDAGGTPATVTLDGTMYYYITNLQGDVVAIWDETSNYICDYYYDAWGKVITRSYSTNHLIDDLNPLLYRGYVYDQDTDLYYLQSRYYNPTIGRFINADALVSTGQGVLGNNMFAYCLNNPVNYSDEDGDRSDSIWGWIGEEIGELIYEWITGEDHPNDQVEALENQIRSNRAQKFVDGAKTLWTAYVHSIELQAQQQYQQDMAVRQHWEDVFSSPKRLNDYLGMVVADIGAYAAYVKLVTASTVTFGPVVGYAFAVGGAIATALNYYGIIDIPDTWEDFRR